MSRGRISLHETELLVSFQRDNDSLNETLENAAAAFCYLMISQTQVTQCSQWCSLTTIFGFITYNGEQGLWILCN